VPDVAGNADPDTGYNVQVDGQQIVVGGTSAVAPLWAGLIALLNQQLNTRLGFVNPTLYNINQSDGFNAITQGNNGAYSASPGWNPCTGQGSPMGSSLLTTLQSIVPQAPAQSQTQPHAQTKARAREHTHST
jgi:kumamolisin